MAGINPVQRSGSFTATRPPRKPEVDPFKDNVQISERRATWGSRVRIKVKETVVNVADWVRREWVALKNDVDRAWQTVKSRASKAASPKETPKVSISVVPKAPDVIPSDPNLAALRVTQEGLKNEKEVARGRGRTRVSYRRVVLMIYVCAPEIVTTAGRACRLIILAAASVAMTRCHSHPV